MVAFDEFPIGCFALMYFVEISLSLIAKAYPLNTGVISLFLVHDFDVLWSVFESFSIVFAI